MCFLSISTGFVLHFGADWSQASMIWPYALHFLSKKTLFVDHLGNVHSKTEHPAWVEKPCWLTSTWSAQTSLDKHSNACWFKLVFSAWMWSHRLLHTAKSMWSRDIWGKDQFWEIKESESLTAHIFPRCNRLYTDTEVCHRFQCSPEQNYRKS